MKIYIFSLKEISLYDYDVYIDTLYERINVLNKINSKKNIIIVTNNSHNAKIKQIEYTIWKHNRNIKWTNTRI